MSTIAYRDGIMAADSFVTGEGTVWGAGAAKIVRSPGGWLGGATGALSFSVAFTRWLNAVKGEELRSDQIASALGESFEESEALLVSPGGTIHVLPGRPVLCPIETFFIASGSGARFAMGAMAAGADAQSAVTIATALDVYTGGKIVTLSLLPGGTRIGGRP